jgi:hypothetical protein
MKPDAPAFRICDAEPQEQDHHVSNEPASKPQSAKTRPPISRARQIFGLVLSIAALAAAYFSYPRRADLRAFDATTMARLESSMWRDYYEKRYLALFNDLYDVSRNEYGFSPLDSVELAVQAARAAKTFQPSTSRAEAEEALPMLVSYYGLMAEATKAPVEVEDVARTELAWWQARREQVPTQQYGIIIARVATMLYGIDNDDIRRFGEQRAEAMAFRDVRGAEITEADWTRITEQLEVAYRLLKNGLAGGTAAGTAKASPAQP